MLTKKLTIEIVEEDHKRIKISAAKAGISMKDFVMRCIRETLKIKDPILKAEPKS